MPLDSYDGFQKLPVSLSGESSLFQVHEQTILDLAAIVRLTDGSDYSLFGQLLGEIGKLHDVELDQNLATRAALLEGELAFAEHESEERQKLTPRLKQNYDARRKLRDDRTEKSSEIVRCQVELLARRQHAEEVRLQNELDRVRQAEIEATTKTDGATSSGADAAPSARQQQIVALTARRDEIITASANTFAREEQLRARFITRTVAGFLLWLGYASVVATGSVLALVMSRADAFEFRPLVSGVRILVSSVFPTLPPWVRLFITLALVLALLWIVMQVFAVWDRKLRDRFQWGEKKSRPDATSQMAPQALSPTTYSRFVALLPFVFAAAIVLVILSLAPESGGAISGSRPNDAAFVRSIFPSVGYSFIGIAIAFLSTAVFVMYFIQLIQPRTEGRAGVLRRGWEFAVLPLLLVAALATLPMQTGVSQMWIPWAAFMLFSSLALACGLVFHGIFKDALKARERIVGLNRKLDRLAGVPSEDDEGDDLSGALLQAASERRSWLERALDRLKRGRPKVAVAEPKTDSLAGAGVAGAPEGASTPDIPTDRTGGLLTEYREIDMVIAPDLVRCIEECRDVRLRIDIELQELSASISELEEILSVQAMEGLRRRHAMLHAIKPALNSHQEERRQHARIDKELLALKIMAMQQSASAVKPLFDQVRSFDAETSGGKEAQ